jgi:hypothetical protein
MMETEYSDSNDGVRTYVMMTTQPPPQKMTYTRYSIFDFMS